MFTKPTMKHIKSKVASSSVKSSATKQGFSSATSYSTPNVVKSGKKKVY